MADSSISLFRRSNRIWYAVYSLGGKRHWKSTGCVGKLEALKVLRTLDLLPKRRTHVHRSLETFLAEFLKFARSTYHKKTWELYALVSKRVSGIAGSQLLEDVSAKIWDEYTAMRSGRVSTTTLNMEQRALKAIMNRAVSWKYLTTSPFAEMKNIRVVEAPPKYFTKAEFVNLLSLVEEAWLQDAIVFAVSTGIRRGELINLHWSDIDLDRQVMTIQSCQDFKVKGNKSRMVPLSSVAMAVITRQERLPGCQYVFHKGGNRLWPNWVTELFRFYVRKAGLREKGLHWHNLRSSFASWLVIDGASIYAVSKLLGHSSVTLTQKYYARLSPETLHSTVDMIKIDFGKN